MRTKKALLAAMCAALLVVGSVMGTMAYLTDTAEVTNTFTYGQVGISLTEAPTDEDGYGQVVAGDRVQGNEYKLIPGHTYAKDPTIFVDAESENCYLFVKIENEIAAIEANGDTTVAKQLEDNGWTCIDETNKIYAHEDVAKAGDEVVVFESFTLAGVGLTNEMVEQYAEDGAEIVVTAYAIQKDGFDSAAAAWAGYMADEEAKD